MGTQYGHICPFSSLHPLRKGRGSQCQVIHVLLAKLLLFVKYQIMQKKNSWNNIFNNNIFFKLSEINLNDIDSKSKSESKLYIGLSEQQPANEADLMMMGFICSHCFFIRFIFVHTSHNYSSVVQVLICYGICFYLTFLFSTV